MSGGLGPDMSALTLLSQQSLTAVLATIPGRKQLLLEPGLMRPLDRVANMSVLSRAGVEKVFKEEIRDIDIVTHVISVSRISTIVSFRNV